MHAPNVGSQQRACDYWWENWNQNGDDDEESFWEEEEEEEEEGLLQGTCEHCAECSGEGVGERSFPRAMRSRDTADYAVEGALGAKAGANLREAMRDGNGKGFL